MSVTAFGSNSVLSVFGDNDADAISLNAANAKAGIFVSGGEDGDAISFVDSNGAIMIYGGTGPSHSAEGADTSTIVHGSSFDERGALPPIAPNGKGVSGAARRSS